MDSIKDFARGFNRGVELASGAPPSILRWIKAGAKTKPMTTFSRGVYQGVAYFEMKHKTGQD